MVRTDGTTYARPARTLRRSEPVAIGEVIAELRAALEVRRPEAPRGPRRPPRASARIALRKRG